MELKYKKDNLKTLYDMCLRELDLTRKNIDLHTRKVKDAYIDALSALENSYGTEDCLVGYDNTLTDLSQLSDALRKFNLKFELTPFFKNININDEDDMPSSTEEYFEPVEVIKRKEKEETFTYPLPLYDKYKPGNKIDVIITYIKNSSEHLFYLNETGNKVYRELVDCLQNYFKESPQALNRVPYEGEVFGLYLEGYMLRAVRANGPLTREYKVYLIDCGEVVTVTKDMDLYVLSFMHQKYCSQAILCKLESVNSFTDINLKAYLEQHVYIEHKIIVKKNTGNMLYVDLLTKENTNPFKNSNSSLNSQENYESTLAKPITNPFRQFFCIGSENGIVKSRSNVTNENHEIIRENIHEGMHQRQDLGNTSQNRAYNNLNSHMDTIKKHRQHDNLKDFLDCTSDDDRSSTSSRNSRSPRGSAKSRYSNGLTEEQARILYEEPLNTTNAMKAVMGYEPKDDKVICPFTRPGKDSCFKGPRCRLEHVEKLKDGWTRDEAETIIDIPSKFVYPKNGQIITLSPKCIVNVERFFAHVISSENRYNTPGFKQFIIKMNAPEYALKYKRLNELPVRFQLVLAQYKDDMFYRAKIVNFIDDEMVKVFYVDYGISDIVTLDRIRQWEKQFDNLPFQAISCRLAGIKEIRTKSVQASEFLRTKLLHEKHFKALVLNSTESLLVRLFYGENGDDISEELINLGFAEALSYDIVPDRGQLIPA